MNQREPAVLLVEDEPGDAFLVRRALEKASIPLRLHHVADGEEAIRYLAGEPPFEDRRVCPLPVLVILDLKLPRRSGFDVLHWRAERLLPRRIPVVVMTSCVGEEDVNRAYELGADSYLVKPVAPEAFQELKRRAAAYWLEVNNLPLLGIS